MPSERHAEAGAHRHHARPAKTSPWAILRLISAIVLGRKRAAAPRHFRDHTSQRKHVSIATGPWLVRKEISRARLILLIVLLLAIVWVGWRVVVETAAQRLAPVSPDAALRLQPREAIALNQLAQRELLNAQGNIENAQAWAQQALRADPLDDTALFYLGFIAERKGDMKTADALARLAGERGWRNLSTQLWLFQRAARRHDFAEALHHADAVMRFTLAGEVRDLLMQNLALFTSDPQALKVLVDELATKPPWRGQFLGDVSQKLVNRSRLDDLYKMLGQTKSPPTRGELISYIVRLVKDGQFAQAQDVWHSTLPAAQQSATNLLYNSDFAAPADTMPFNWQLTGQSGADLQIVPTDGAAKRALHIEFSGARIGDIGVRHLTALAPGRYRLSGEVRAQNLKTARGLWWRIVCVDKQQTSLGETDLVSGTIPWSAFRLNFRVPDETCPAQVLHLQLPARAAVESQIEGEVWYRGLEIGPISADAVTPEPVKPQP
jgi:tetratricopeptide (TPR) repeat protein